MGLFDGTPTPNFMSTPETLLNFMKAGESQGQSFSHAFTSAFGQVEQQAFQKAQQQQMMKKMAPVAQALQGVKTPSDAFGVISQNPAWLVDPQTGPFVGKILKDYTDIAKAEAASIEGKLKIKDATQFYRDLEGIDAESRVRIQGMTRNPDGTPTAQQMEALRLAQQSSEVARQNKQSLAELEAEQARQAGAKVTTHVTPKGDVSYTIEKGGAGSAVEPVVKNFGGVDFVLNPKTGHLTKITASGKEAQIGVSELFKQYSAEKRVVGNEKYDATAQQTAKDSMAFIQNYVRDKFPNQSALFGIKPGYAPTPQAQPAGMPTVKTKEQFDSLPSGTIYIGEDGKRYKKP